MTLVMVVVVLVVRCRLQPLRWRKSEPDRLPPGAVYIEMDPSPFVKGRWSVN